MTRTDTTPFRDPRNAVGLLTDVFDAALSSPKAARAEADVLDTVTCARDLGREFTRAPRIVLNGYKRKGMSGLYQRVKAVQAKLNLLEDSWQWGVEKRELLSMLRALSGCGLAIIVRVMEDADSWEKLNQPTAREDPEWPRQWHDHTSNALRLGADLAVIQNIEVEWRWRDLTDRSHRGRNVKAAFEAAWLAGQYKFAQQLLEDA
jgi:hypothetical protein